MSRPEKVLPASRAYAVWAATYDTDANRTRDLDAAVVRRIGLHVEGRDVVELGCGTGKNTMWLAGRARSIVSLDFSEEMLARARSRVTGPHVRFVRHDIREAWPLEARSVDLAIANLVLEHVEDLALVCGEAARVLRPGGQLFLCELHPERQRRGIRAEFRDPATGTLVGIEACLHTTADYVDAATGAGFTLLHQDEWFDDWDPADGLPRLVSVLFERGTAQADFA